MRKIKDIFKPKKHSAEIIAVVDWNGNTLFQGTAENIPLSEEAIVKLSVKFFKDPAPCEIHRSAVRIRAFYEVWEACPEEGKIRFNELPVELQEFFGEFPSESYVVRWVD